MTPAVTPLNYPLSIAALWRASNYASRAAVPPNQKVPAFNPAFPIKGWVLPAGGQFAYFDPQNAAGGYVSYLPPMSDAQAQAFNLPGAAPVVPYVVAPCQISWVGGIVDVSGFVCNKDDALSVMAMIQPLYPVTLSLIETDQGLYAFQYAPGEGRREWVISPFGYNAQALIAAMNWPGVGLPGHFEKNATGGLVWIGGQQITAAPAGAICLPTPIRALLPGEQIVPVRSLPGSSTSYQVTNVAAQIAILESLIAQYTAQLQALQAA